MKTFAWFGKKLQNLCSVSRFKFPSFCKSTCFLFSFLCKLTTQSTSYISVRVNPFLTQLFYFIFVSLLGFWVLKALRQRTERPGNLDLFFTSVSASTVSSMSTVEMEVFSNTQLIVMTILMFIGGEVFSSMVGLHLLRPKLRSAILKTENKIHNSSHDLTDSIPMDLYNEIELGTIVAMPNQEIDQFHVPNKALDDNHLKYNSIKFLGYVVLGYLLLIHEIGIVFVLVYITLDTSARNVLTTKGLNTFTFSIFTTVSTFASCGFVPTNENMMVFSKNSSLLLILIPQILMGNTLFPSCLRFSVWFLGKFVKKVESKHLLKNTRDIGFLHLLPSLHSSLLVATVLGFIVIQFILFCSMEWNSDSLGGLNSKQKLAGVLFQTVNSRHTGETIVDLSIISPAILVLFFVMMYLPPYTSFLPVKDGEQESGGRKKRRGKIVENLIFSLLSYLLIFIILICITERKKMKQDPLNFSVLNVMVEVISAYGNVGFTTGYSCKRQVNPDSNCKDKWFGFSGKWSDEGKIILIVVMIFGRLKKFNMNGGRAWKLL